MATQHLKLHPLTGNTDHDVTGLSSGQILYVQNPTNGVQSTGIYTDGSGSLTANSASLTILSAGTLNSGSTNLYNIFLSSALSGTSGNLWSSSTGSNSIIANNSTNNTASGQFAVVAGSGNTVSGNVSSIGGGIRNTITSAGSFIGAGTGNTASGVGSFIGAGTGNTASNNQSVVVGGFQNTASGQRSFIGGGSGNTASSTFATIVGGLSNVATQVYSFVGGGRWNRATGSHSFIGGGSQNSASTTYSTIVGGFQNISSSQRAVIVGGRNNSAITAVDSFVGGGRNNITNSNYSVVAGGQLNISNGIASFIGAGGQNSAITANASSVVGGSNNGVFGQYSFIGGGQYNTVNSYNASIVGGQSNNITTNYSFVGGGKFNLVSGNSFSTLESSSVVVGGINNKAIGGAYGNGSFIGGGKNNFAGGNYYTASVVVGGNDNKAYGDYSLIVGGKANSASTDYSAVVGGRNNSAYGLRSFIGGGQSNQTASDSSVVVGGENNKAYGDKSFVGAGVSNLSLSPFSLIVGGKANSASTDYSIVVGGKINTASGKYTSILNGSGNTASGQASSILAGTGHTVTGINSAVIGGGSITASANDTVYMPNARLAETAGSIIYSAGTPLQNIFAVAGSGVQTVGQGTNIQTGGTVTNPTISTVASPSFNSITYSGTSTGGNSIAINVSATTFYSASTNLETIIYNIAIATEDVTRVQPGTNITTGGTANNPTINLVASPSVNGFTASGTANFTGALQSGGTDLANIFVQGSGTNGTLPLWTGTKLLSNSLLSQSGTGVTVNGSVYIYGNVDVLGTATTFNTQTIQTADNNITLNLSGSHVSAYGGGITVLSGTPANTSSTWTIDANGSWSSNTSILTSAITVNGGNINVTGGGSIQSGGTDLYNIFAQPNSVVNSVQPGTNITTGGTSTSPTISLVASPSVNGITASGTSYFNLASASTLSAYTAYINNLNGYSPITVNDTLKFTSTTAISGGTSQATLKINSYSQSDFELSSDQGNYVTGGTFYVGRDGIGAYIDGGAAFFADKPYTLVANKTNGAYLTLYDNNAGYENYVDIGAVESGTTNGYASLNVYDSVIADYRGFVDIRNGITRINQGGANGSGIYITPTTVNLVSTGITIASISGSALNMYNNKIINVPIPTAGLDAVNKNYVDALVTGSTSGSVLSVIAGSNITTGGTSTSPIINLDASPSVNNFTASGDTSLQGTTGTTIHATQFFSMTPYTGANPVAPADNTFWFYSAATGLITLRYKVGGVTKVVELS